MVEPLLVCKAYYAEALPTFVSSSTWVFKDTYDLLSCLSGEHASAKTFGYNLACVSVSWSSAFDFTALQKLCPNVENLNLRIWYLEKLEPQPAHLAIIVPWTSIDAKIDLLKCFAHLFGMDMLWQLKSLKRVTIEDVGWANSVDAVQKKLSQMSYPRQLIGLQTWKRNIRSLEAYLNDNVLQMSEQDRANTPARLRSEPLEQDWLLLQPDSLQ